MRWNTTGLHQTAVLKQSEPGKYGETRVETNRARLEFVRNEIESAIVFGRLAETEGVFGDRAAAAAAMEKAERACEVGLEHISKARMRSQDIQELEQALDQVRRKIGALRARFQ